MPILQMQKLRFMEILGSANAQGSSGFNLEQEDPQPVVYCSAALLHKFTMPSPETAPFFPSLSASPNSCSLTSKPAQEEVVISLGQGGQQVLKVLLELRWGYDGQKFSCDPSATLICHLGTLQVEDHIVSICSEPFWYLGIIHLQPTIGGRKHWVLLKLWGALPPPRLSFHKSKQGHGIPVLTNMPE